MVVGWLKLQIRFSSSSLPSATSWWSSEMFGFVDMTSLNYIKKKPRHVPPWH